MHLFLLGSSKSEKSFTSIISGVLSFFVIKPTYEASTKVFVGKEESSLEGYNTNDIQMYQKLLQTYAETIKTNEVIQAAINNTNADLSIKDVKSSLTVTPISDTQILQIKYQNNDPEVAKSIMLNKVPGANILEFSYDGDDKTPKYDGTNDGGLVYDNSGTAYVGDIKLDSNGNVDVNTSEDKLKLH